MLSKAFSKHTSEQLPCDGAPLAEISFTIRSRVHPSPSMRQIPDSKQLVALMLTAIRMSIQAELDVFFGHLQDRSQLARTVSEQAFAQARAKQDVAAKIMCDNLQTLATLTAGD